MPDWDPIEFEVYIRAVEYVSGATEKDLDVPLFDLDREVLGNADRALITVQYPDGSSDTRWFGGPWDDYDDVWYDVIEWYEDGTP